MYLITMRKNISFKEHTRKKDDKNIHIETNQTPKKITTSMRKISMIFSLIDNLHVRFN